MSSPSFAELVVRATRALAQVPDYVWDGRSLPVPIESIAEDHFGLLVREVDDVGIEVPTLDVREGQRISGALVPQRAEILVSAPEAHAWPRRRRYTIAHELGHWVLHRDSAIPRCRTAQVEPVKTVTYGILEPFDYPADYDLSDSESEIAARREWEANVFGGALLLPPRLVREFWDQHPSIEEMAEAFDCSPSAIGGRWEYHYRLALEEEER